MQIEPLNRDGIACVNRIATASRPEDAWNECVAFVLRAGFAGVNYGLTRGLAGQSIGDPSEVLFLSSHSLDAVRDHHQSGRYRDMPEYRWVLENVGAMPWSWVEQERAAGRLSPREVAALDALPAGRARAGYSISFPETHAREKGAMGLPAPTGVDQSAVDTIWARNGASVMAVAHMCHARLLQLPMPVLDGRLSPRQIELLEWIADGKSRADLCVLTGLSMSSVEKYLARARETLAVETTAQAVAKLAFMNQLFSTRDAR